MRPYRYQLLLLVVDVAFYALCMLLAPLLISFVVDNVIQGVPFDNGFLQNLVNAFGGMQVLQDNLWIWSCMIVAAYIIVALAINRRSLHSGNVAETLALNIRNAMYDHLQKLPFAYHKSRDSGDLIQRSTSDIETIRRFFCDPAIRDVVCYFKCDHCCVDLISSQCKTNLIVDLFDSFYSVSQLYLLFKS